MQEEIWKDIPNYEGCYQVSNLARVKSLARRNGKRVVVEKILRTFLTESRKYISVSLSLNGKLKLFSVHQLVAMAFLNHKPNGNTLVVDHIDGDKLNNNLSNLRVITHSQNLTNIKRKKRAPRTLKKRVAKII
jgi:hypothetical protein